MLKQEITLIHQLMKTEDSLISNDNDIFILIAQ